MPNDEARIDTVIVLGAGASAADGAPIQSCLFREYFKQYRTKSGYDAHHEWDRELATFFFQFFGIDVDSDELDHVEFPTFEEILGILEIADSQGESFPDLLGPHLIKDGTSGLQHIHDVVVFSIAEILHHKLSGRNEHHKRLVGRLEATDDLQRTAFVTFNYDILIDNALLDALGDWSIEYGTEFANHRDRLPNHAVRLFKLHGSLNWLFCSTCRDLWITPGEKGVMKLKWEPHDAICERCESPRSPIVIPPTFFKVLSNLHIRKIWDVAERECLNAQRIIFCGYSFPDADLHVRYLLKRVEQLKKDAPEIFVVNHHDGKSKEAADWEFARYRRFFVDKSKVHYTNVSFEEFAESPTVIEDHSRWQS